MMGSDSSEAFVTAFFSSVGHQGSYLLVSGREGREESGISALHADVIRPPRFVCMSVCLYRSLFVSHPM